MLADAEKTEKLVVALRKPTATNQIVRVHPALPLRIVTVSDDGAISNQRRLTPYGDPENDLQEVRHPATVLASPRRRVR